MTASGSARDARPYIYAAIDGLLLLLYLVLALWVAPSRHLLGAFVQWSLVGCMALAAGGSLWRTMWGRRVAIAGCTGLLVLELCLLVLILASASFLAGVYGSIGKGAAAVALVVAALSIEVVALPAAFQLKYLMTRAGRRAYVP